MTEFIGFPRPDGSIGIRNHIVMIGYGQSCYGICHTVCGLVKDAVPVYVDPEDEDVFSNLVSHPNVAGIVVVGDGFEGEAVGSSLSHLERTGKPHDVIDIRTLDQIDAISKTTRSMVEIIRDVSTQRRELTRFSALLPTLLHVPAKVIKDVLSGFIRLLSQDNGRCLWMEKKSRNHAAVNSDIKKMLAGQIKSGQRPGPNPGMYKYTGTESAGVLLKAMQAWGTQIMVCPMTEGRSMTHPLIPSLTFNVDRDSNSSDGVNLDLSKVRDGKLTVEDAGLLLLSEIVATASGKLTRNEIVRNVVIAA